MSKKSHIDENVCNSGRRKSDGLLRFCIAHDKGIAKIRKSIFHG
jgi:hypothetical protein